MFGFVQASEHQIWGLGISGTFPTSLHCCIIQAERHPTKYARFTKEAVTQNRLWGRPHLVSKLYKAVFVRKNAAKKILISCMI